MKKSYRKSNSKNKSLAHKITANFVLGTMAAAMLPMAVSTVKADEVATNAVPTVKAEEAPSRSCSDRGRQLSSWQASQETKQA